MPRHPLPPGGHGNISRVPIHRRRIASGKYQDVALVRGADGQHYAREDTDHTEPLPVTSWRASCRVRDHDGHTRKVEAAGPSGAAAERALQRALANRHPTTGGKITPDTRVTDLWTAYRQQCIDDGKAARTLDAYDEAAVRINAGLGGLRIRETGTQRLDQFLDEIATHNGPAVAKRCRSVLSGMFRLAARYGAIQHNPVREVRPVKATRTERTFLTAADVRTIVGGMRSSTTPLPPAPGAKRQTSRITVSEYAREADIADPILFLACTGARIGEALALRWQDVDLDAGTVTITGHVVTAKGQPLARVDGAKSESGVRTLHIPPIAVDMLRTRLESPMSALSVYVFPSSTGNVRDPNSFRKPWRRVASALGYEGLGTHAFRKAVATEIDAAGLSSRVAADVLGHAQVSMTTDAYFARNRAHAMVAGVIQDMLTGSAGQDTDEN
ncbi:site-specific integrase [Rhodococcus sp. CX]|uniref:tyrosine-type recombinase/integrase n=1 Tax=Rhodococcus sp. CX TaxID=2789880 RepID=UPI0018CE44A6|nr:site-specific integrase [Rhodococcus sp. CX]MBH0121587.1 site-specific integrase [Rhodococcus sp. CX]